MHSPADNSPEIILAYTVDQPTQTLTFKRGDVVHKDDLSPGHLLSRYTIAADGETVTLNIADIPGDMEVAF